MKRKLFKHKSVNHKTRTISGKANEQIREMDDESRRKKMKLMLWQARRRSSCCCCWMWSKRKKVLSKKRRKINVHDCYFLSLGCIKGAIMFNILWLQLCSSTRQTVAMNFFLLLLTFYYNEPVLCVGLMMLMAQEIN